MLDVPGHIQSVNCHYPNQQFPTHFRNINWTIINQLIIQTNPKTLPKEPKKLNNFFEKTKISNSKIFENKNKNKSCQLKFEKTKAGNSSWQHSPSRGQLMFWSHGLRLWGDLLHIFSLKLSAILFGDLSNIIKWSFIAYS